MEKNKTYIAGDNIISPLGWDTESNMQAVRGGESGISSQMHFPGVPEEVAVAAIRREALNNAFGKLSPNGSSYTPFEQVAILSAADAIQRAGIDASAPETLFILSTTKGNIELLEQSQPGPFSRDRLYLWRSAEEIARFFDNTNRPLIISNACISGVSALILGHRLLQNGVYKQVVVTGADMLTAFTISGFLSFKALSPLPCRPFDQAREGLNLGEGAATLVLASDIEERLNGRIVVENGAISNDANHISGPSRTGEGLYRAITRAMQGCRPEEIGFINAHGTATLYNDEMESIAIHRAGLTEVPVNSLKAYFGHTLGAAGVIESIVSAHALAGGFVPSSLGFQEPGTTHLLQIPVREMKREMKQCIKTASGFGGCNAAIRLKKQS